MSQPAKDDEEEEEIPERMTAEDAWLFPILGSIVLVGLYLTFKYIDPEWINWLFGWYFAVMGAASVWKVQFFFRVVGSFCASDVCTSVQSSVSLSRYILGRRIWKGFAIYRLLLLKGPFGMLSTPHSRSPHFNTLF